MCYFIFILSVIWLCYILFINLSSFILTCFFSFAFSFEVFLNLFIIFTFCFMKNILNSRVTYWAFCCIPVVFFSKSTLIYWYIYYWLLIDICWDVYLITVWYLLYSVTWLSCEPPHHSGLWWPLCCPVSDARGGGGVFTVTLQPGLLTEAAEVEQFPSDRTVCSSFDRSVSSDTSDPEVSSPRGGLVAPSSAPQPHYFNWWICDQEVASWNPGWSDLAWGGFRWQDRESEWMDKGGSIWAQTLTDRGDSEKVFLTYQLISVQFKTWKEDQTRAESGPDSDFLRLFYFLCRWFVFLSEG